MISQLFQIDVQIRIIKTRAMRELYICMLISPVLARVHQRTGPPIVELLVSSS